MSNFLLTLVFYFLVHRTHGTVPHFHRGIPQVFREENIQRTMKGNRQYGVLGISDHFRRTVGNDTFTQASHNHKPNKDEESQGLVKAQPSSKRPAGAGVGGGGEGVNSGSSYTKATSRKGLQEASPC